MLIQPLRSSFGYLFENDWALTLDSLDIQLLRNTMARSGAILLRGFGAGQGDFEKITKAFIGVSLVHQSTGGARDVKNKEGTTTTVDKGLFSIGWHRERAYAPQDPDILAFYCVTPAARGGETYLCDGVELLAGLSPKTRSFVLRNRLTWRWCAPSRKWMRTLGVGSREQAGAAARVVAASMPAYERFHFKMIGDIMAGAYTTPIAGPVPWSGGRAFANYVLNGICQPCFKVSLENGDPFPLDVIQEAKAVADEICYPVRWRAGDILVLNNKRLMHARPAFSDPNRMLLARMGKAGFHLGDLAESAGKTSANSLSARGNGGNSRSVREIPC